MMQLSAAQLTLVLGVLWFTAGCRSVDPAAAFIAQMNDAPAERRPKDWERTKTLMARPAPVLGQLAPDFSLRTLDDTGTIARSAHQSGRPLVLIFGSFT